ncbi:hypothetical protein J4207_06085 [Candidatus Woesearchaeota archaeon]|nr:hypothetical protein [Candidatus Woesearchaeota archaeon]HLC80864.1 hypothetical protein [Candidatus Nanoarchaeia archaeon]
MEKKGQLAGIEFHYFMAGLMIGLILVIVLVILLNRGVIGFNVPLLSCPALK